MKLIITLIYVSLNLFWGYATYTLGNNLDDKQAWFTWSIATLTCLMNYIDKEFKVLEERIDSNYEYLSKAIDRVHDTILYKVEEKKK